MAHSRMPSTGNILQGGLTPAHPLAKLIDIQE